MKTQKTSLLLVLALLFAPVLPAFADDAPTPSTPAASSEAAAAPLSSSAQAPAAAIPLSPAAEAVVKRPGDTDAPDLPEVKEGDVPAEAPVAVTGTAEVEVPKDEIAIPGKAKPDVPESKYKWSNFTLGFLGGAVVGSAAGILFMSRGDDGSFDADKAKVVAPVVGAAAGLVFGLAALWLGATTPEEAKPPKVESALPPLAPPSQVADLGLRLDLSF